MTQFTSLNPKGALPKVWVCPDCRKVITSNFCPWCGKKKPSDPICPKCGKSYDATGNYLFCPNCGENLNLMRDEISDTWDEIIAAIDNGTACQRYAVGAFKPFTLGRYGVINMQLAGFDLDERADGKGKAATTWIAKELLPVTHRMNPEYRSREMYEGGVEGTGMVGGWEKSELRRWLNDVVLPGIPSVIRDRLLVVKKTQKALKLTEEKHWVEDELRRLWTSSIQISYDKLWIPDGHEVFGDDATYYDLFLDKKEKRIRKKKDTATWWWLRSTQYYVSACGVDEYGSFSGRSVEYTDYGVVIGFCL